MEQRSPGGPPATSVAPGGAGADRSGSPGSALLLTTSLGKLPVLMLPRNVAREPEAELTAPGCVPVTAAAVAHCSFTMMARGFRSSSLFIYYASVIYSRFLDCWGTAARWRYYWYMPFRVTRRASLDSPATQVQVASAATL